MSKNVKKILGKAAPLASLIPGVGPLGAAAIGAAGGALSGGGLKGALIGGATGALGSSLGAGGALADTVVGRAVGGISNSLSDTLLGRGVKALGSSITQGINPNAGSGSFGSIKNYINPISTAISGYQQYQTEKDVEDEILRGQRQAAGALQPYSEAGLAATQRLSQNLEQGFNPGDLASDPGYQFRLSQGQKGLERSLSASGLGSSGAALKAAQEYGQGMASQEYADAYNRWLQQNAQLSGVSGSGQQAAQGLGDIYATSGAAKGAALSNRSNIINKTLSQILSGRGALEEEEQQ